MAILFTLDVLTKLPYNDPHYTRDELIFYVLSDAYVLPIAMHDDIDPITGGTIPAPVNGFVTIGGLPLRKTKSPWKTNGSYVYLISQSLSNTLSTDVILNDSIKNFFAANAYVTSRLHFIQFEKSVLEGTTHIVGFIVKSKYLKITTKQDEINLDLKPSTSGDLPI